MLCLHGTGNISDIFIYYSDNFKDVFFNNRLLEWYGKPIFNSKANIIFVIQAGASDPELKGNFDFISN
jgi:hypothetical protein